MTANRVVKPFNVIGYSRPNFVSGMGCDIYVWPVGELWMAAICKDGRRVVAFGGFDSPGAAIAQAKDDLPVCGCSDHNQPIYVKNEAAVPK